VQAMEMEPVDQSDAQHAGRHELGALLKVLIAKGYDWDSIQFEGVRDLYPRRGPLVMGCVERGQRVTIQLNTGLLSITTALPSYFRQFALRLPNPDSFVEFMGFWDAMILRNFAYSCYPEVGVARHSGLPNSYRARLSLSNPVALHWLFRSCFPELRVKVKAALFSRLAQLDAARVGAELGSRAVLGAGFREKQVGFRVLLHAEAESSEGVSDWEKEALQRLSRIRQLLLRLKVPLEVRLYFEQYRHGLALGLADRRLGVRPWELENPEERIGPAEVLLRGPWPEAPG
jgi:hypothetical protein